MITSDGEFIVCDADLCINKIKNHAWGKIKAEGWFFSKDDTQSLCPDHVPEWYDKWKKVRR